MISRHEPRDRTNSVASRRALAVGHTTTKWLRPRRARNKNKSKVQKKTPDARIRSGLAGALKEEGIREAGEGLLELGCRATRLGRTGQYYRDDGARLKPEGVCARKFRPASSKAP